MHLLLLIVRLFRTWLAPIWRDSLTLAARADGRMEHMPARPTLWKRWLNRAGREGSRRAASAPRLRAEGSQGRSRRRPDSD
jgi:hypothetical protein